MNTIAFYIIALLIGYAGGYMTKDLLTIEKKVEVTINKQKIKGDYGSVDNDFEVDVQQKNKPKRKLFKFLKRNK